MQEKSVVCRNLVNAAFSISDAPLVLPWVLSLRSIAQFGPLCWDASLTYVAQHASANTYVTRTLPHMDISNSAIFRDVALSFFLELASDPSGRPALPSVLPNGRVRCAPLAALVNRILLRSTQASAAAPKQLHQSPKKSKRSKGEKEAEHQTIDTTTTEDASAVSSSRLWLALECVALLESDKAVRETLEKVAASLAKRPHSRANRFLLAAAVTALTAYWRDYGLVAELREACPEIAGHVLETPREPALVAAVAGFIHLLQKREEAEESGQKSAGKRAADERRKLTDKLRDALQENFSSSVAPLREATLSLLSALSHPQEAQSVRLNSLDHRNPLSAGMQSLA